MWESNKLLCLLQTTFLHSRSLLLHSQGTHLRKIRTVSKSTCCKSCKRAIRMLSVTNFHTQAGLNHVPMNLSMAEHLHRAKSWLNSRYLFFTCTYGPPYPSHFHLKSDFCDTPGVKWQWLQKTKQKMMIYTLEGTLDSHPICRKHSQQALRMTF